MSRGPERWSARILLFAIAATMALVLAPAAASAAWKPGAAGYGVARQHNLAVTAPDGATLRADVYTPTDPDTGQVADGSFPVIVTQTPYGKDDAQLGGTAGQLAGYSEYLVKRGYIQVIADVRGTGGSCGQFGLFDPEQGQDGAAIVRWAAGLPHSDGKVGLLGESYLGINQFATAAAAGPHSPIKAMFPIIAANELYRDTAFAGGFPDIEFDAVYLGLTGSLNLINPAAEANPDLFAALQDHAKSLGTFDAQLLLDTELGGPRAYDQDYWQQRSPLRHLKDVVKFGIPAYLVGGWFDLFQRGEPLNYSGLQNAYRGRSPLAPMAAGQEASPRYQLLQGPWYHVTYGEGLNYHGLNLDGIELAWFDHWLKGADTGITDTHTPAHLYDLGNGKWRESARYPFEQATPRTWYLGADKTLTRDKPTAATGADSLIFAGTRVPCSNATEQWAAGAGILLVSLFGVGDPCATNGTPSQQGPAVRNYTTAPFSSARTLAGPIGARLYATATTHDTEWVVTVSDVGPDNQARELTSGLLEGNQRSLDSGRTWRAPDGNPILPYHPYTQAARSPVTPGQLTRFDVEVFPTVATIPAGHRLRITVATADFPHALPTVAQIPNLVGGVYRLQRNAAGPSSVELPMASPSAFAAPRG